MPEDRINLLDELSWRGMLAQTTDREALESHLSDPEGQTRKGYVGLDPSADSLTIGNLVPIMAAVHFARAGHTPVILMGGGTGLIGDPSGKSAERTLQTEDTVRANVDRQRDIYVRCFAGAGLPAPTIVNNLDWLGGMSYIAALRDVGKHFSVNMMLQKESVKERLHNREQGISYTEFSYMILQAYDFAHLFKEGVTVQFGGSDQWGNMVAGKDLIRRERDEDESADSHVFTLNLITKADGGKFGKTESGAVWLTGPGDGGAGDPDQRTSPYAFFQFWLNSSDDDVFRFLRIFTLLSEKEILALEATHADAPHKREAHRELARHATTLVHGADNAELAERAGRALFSGDIAGLPEELLLDVFENVPSSDHDKTALDGDGADPVELLTATGLAKSNREAREFLANGSVSVNGEKLAANDRLTAAHLLHGSLIALRRGKKEWRLTRWG